MPVAGSVTTVRAGSPAGGGVEVWANTSPPDVSASRPISNGSANVESGDALHEEHLWGGPYPTAELVSAT